MSIHDAIKLLYGKSKSILKWFKSKWGLNLESLSGQKNQGLSIYSTKSSVSHQPTEDACLTIIM